MEVGDELPTALYRFYDASDALLYVGITGELKTRFAQHAADKRWWAKVARKTVEWHPTRQAASLAELAAIRTEHPAYNVAGAPTAKRKRRGAPFAPPGHVPDPDALIDRLRELVAADIGHADVVLRAAAVVMCGDRIPRGAQLDHLAQACGVSRSHAYRVLREQDASDANYR
jgi:predicted GIY-YIG superfamily endonuclease